MPWVIVYTDGAYEYKQGSGFPTISLDEARRFPTKEEAEEHAEDLIGVSHIAEIGEELQ